MTKKINHDVKETALEALKEHGTMQYAAGVCGVSVRTLNEEMRRSEVFRRRVVEARAEGKENMSDVDMQFIQDVATGKIETKMPRLTAALAICNAFVPGFRGQTIVQGRIEHDVRVITAVPRPEYPKIEAPKVKVLENKKLLDKPKTKAHNIEEVIEGEVIKDA